MLAAGPWDESSLRDIRDDSIDRQIGHYIDRDDMVSTVMSTFVSTTVHCARCHDHKFDPISQDDYYSLQAVFAGVDKAERGYDTDPASTGSAIAHAELKAPRKRNPTRRAGSMRSSRRLPPQQLVFAGASDSHPTPATSRRAGRGRARARRGDIHRPANRPPGHARAAWPSSRRVSSRRTTMNRPAARPRPLDHRPAESAHLAVDRQPRLARAFRPRAGLHAQRLRPDGALPLTRNCSTGWRPSSVTRAARSRQLAPADRHERGLPPERPSMTRFAAKDADNQWLWRQNRRRLDAESRSTTRFLQRRGPARTHDGRPVGPAVHASPGVHVTPVVDYTKYDWNSPGSCRRSVYRFVFRTLPDPFLDALDSADASQFTAGAQRVDHAAPGARAPQQPVRAAPVRAVRGALADGRRASRRPDSAGVSAGIRPPADARRARAASATPAAHGLVNFCRLIINSNEFLFVN